jgi:hypothetical protein
MSAELPPDASEFHDHAVTTPDDIGVRCDYRAAGSTFLDYNQSVPCASLIADSDYMREAHRWRRFFRRVVRGPEMRTELEGAVEHLVLTFFKEHGELNNKASLGWLDFLETRYQVWVDDLSFSSVTRPEKTGWFEVFDHGSIDTVGFGPHREREITAGELHGSVKRDTYMFTLRFERHLPAVMPSWRVRRLMRRVNGRSSSDPLDEKLAHIGEIGLSANAIALPFLAKLAYSVSRSQPLNKPVGVLSYHPYARGELGEALKHYDDRHGSDHPKREKAENAIRSALVQLRTDVKKRDEYCS